MIPSVAPAVSESCARQLCASVPGSPSAKAAANLPVMTRPPIRRATIGREAIDDDRDAALVGVQAVRLVQLWVHRHTFEKKGIKRQVIGLCKVGVDAVEITFVILAPIRRRLHPRQQQFGAAFLDPGDHRREVGAHRRRVDAAQRIVGAEFEDHQRRLVSQRPIQPRQPARRGVARHPGIDHLRRDLVFLQPCFEPRRKRRLRRQPETGGQAVAKHQDFRHRRRCAARSQPTRCGASTRRPSDSVANSRCGTSFRKAHTPAAAHPEAERAGTAELENTDRAGGPRPVVMAPGSALGPRHDGNRDSKVSSMVAD